MVAKGYGEERPLRMADGVVLTEKYILSKKTKQEQEALFDLNRRSVFKVLSWDYVDPTAPLDQSQRKIIHPKVNAGAFDDSGDTTGADVQDSPVDGGAPNPGGTAAPAGGTTTAPAGGTAPATGTAPKPADKPKPAAKPKQY